MTNFEKIIQIVNWWEGLRADYEGLNEVMLKRQQLSAYLYNVANDMAEARKAWAEAKSLHEKHREQDEVRFRKTAATVTEAKQQARANNAGFFEMEEKAEALYFGLNHKFKAIEHILEAMGQRIAILRREWEMRNYAAGQ